jgi:hypothetical protein
MPPSSSHGIPGSAATGKIQTLSAGEFFDKERKRTLNPLGVFLSADWRSPSDD